MKMYRVINVSYSKEEIRYECLSTQHLFSGTDGHSSSLQDSKEEGRSRRPSSVISGRLIPRGNYSNLLEYHVYPIVGCLVSGAREGARGAVGKCSICPVCAVLQGV